MPPRILYRLGGFHFSDCAFLKIKGAQCDQKAFFFFTPIQLISSLGKTNFLKINQIARKSITVGPFLQPIQTEKGGTP
jgi:hypothetical protein